MNLALFPSLSQRRSVAIKPTRPRLQPTRPSLQQVPVLHVVLRVCAALYAYLYVQFAMLPSDAALPPNLIQARYTSLT